MAKRARPFSKLFGQVPSSADKSSTVPLNSRTMQNADIGETVRQTMMVLTLIIVAAKLGGELMGRLGQPPVLGELIMGVVLGNLNLFGVTLLNPLKSSSLLSILAEIGAILLLFEVGV